MPRLILSSEEHVLDDTLRRDSSMIASRYEECRETAHAMPTQSVGANKRILSTGSYHLIKVS